MLAVRAARTGAIDYSKTTRDDVPSVVREGLILRDVKREMLATALGVFDIAYTSPGNRVFQTEYVRNAIPWLATPDDGKSAQEREAQSLVDAWNEYQAYKKAKKDAAEKTRLPE